MRTMSCLLLAAVSVLAIREPVARFAAGKPLINVSNKQKGY